ncbi:MAG TPA: DUF4386 domain-containing protein [Gemmatimonadaceae bacterium]|nr:DUF4386 domain-containing protein [Gemmatimonadaceae bacterium]
MTSTYEDTSPLFTARMAGALWLIVIIIGGLDVATSSIVVAGDAAATARNILNSEFRFRLGEVGEFIGGACYLGVTVLLYQLLKPVSKTLSLFAACCGAIGLAIGAAGTVRDLGAVALLRSGQLPGAADAGQMQGVALSTIKLFGLGFSVSMVYFGLQVASVGILIARSSFFPRALGVLAAIGGSIYVIGSLAMMMSPPIGGQLFRFVIPVAFIGEGSLTLWLLFKGVNVERWIARANPQPRRVAA